MAKGSRGDRYPIFRYTIDDLHTFIESPLFTAQWNYFGLTDADLSRFQTELLSNPFSGPVIRNTNGVRKVRFRPAEGGKGKSGGCRVCYVFQEEFSTFILLFVFSKSEKVDLSPIDRKIVRREVDRLNTILRKRPARNKQRESEE